MEWTFPEFETHERGTAWFFWMTLLGGSFFLGAIFTGNFLFALIIILVTILLVLYHQRGPRTLTCTLTEEGITIADTEMQKLREIGLEVQRFFDAKIEPNKHYAIDMEVARQDNEWQVVQARVILLGD